MIYKKMEEMMTYKNPDEHLALANIYFVVNMMLLGTNHTIYEDKMGFL